MSPSEIRKSIAAFRLGYLTRILVPALDEGSRANAPDIIWRQAGKPLQKALGTLGDKLAPDVSRKWSQLVKKMVAYVEKRDSRLQKRVSRTEDLEQEYYKGLIEEIGNPASDYPRDFPDPVSNLDLSSRYREWHNGGDVLASAVKIVHCDSTGIPRMELSSESFSRTLPVAMVRHSRLLQNLCQRGMAPMALDELIERIPQPKREDFRRAFVTSNKPLESVPRHLLQAYKDVLSERQEVSLRLVFCTTVSMEMKVSLEKDADTPATSSASEPGVADSEQDVVDTAAAGTKKKWYHGPDDTPPLRTRFGPLVGYKKDLAKACRMDHRALADICDRGVSLWGRRRVGGKFELWFSDNKSFKQAEKRLADIQQS